MKRKLKRNYNYNFNFGDIVELTEEFSASGKAVQGIVTKVNPKEFFVKWSDGGVSTEQQDDPVGIIKVQDNA